MKNLIPIFLLVILFCHDAWSQPEPQNQVVVQKEMLNAYSRDSTEVIPAIKHMFKRKRGGGVARAVIFGGLAIGALLMPEPTKVVETTTIYTQPPSTVVKVVHGTETVSQGPALNYAVCAGMTLIAVTGISQASRYSERKLQMVLRSYRAGNGIPAEYKKLAAKDFKSR